MSMFKVGQKVRVLEKAVFVSQKQGQTVTVERVSSFGLTCRADDGIKIGCFLSEVEALPEFKAGDLVRVKASGQTAEILCVWHSEGREDEYELEEEFCPADELELLPEKREPKAGEVWSVHNCPCLIAHDDKTLVTVVLEVARVYTGVGRVDAQRFDAIGATFLAPDLTAYFKDRPC